MTDAQTLSHVENLLAVVEKLNNLDTQRADELRALSNRVESLTRALHELREEVATALVEGGTLG